MILIRHGRTAWNAQKRYMGSTDIALDDEGLRQARALKARMRSERVDSVYSSDSKRAYDFASIVFEAHGIEKMAGLREMNFGIIEGMTYEEISRKHPDAYSEWMRDIHSAAIPDGESLEELKRRVLDAFGLIVRRSRDATVAIVTHAGPIRIIINELTGSHDFWQVMPDSGSVTIVEMSQATARVIILNDTSHLEA